MGRVQATGIVKGLELSRAYYWELIRPVLNSIPELATAHAAGLIGWGSDVLGHDDDYSRDHEWGPRCLLFLPEERGQECAAVYEALNRQLPGHFKGYPTRFRGVWHADQGVRVASADGGDVHIQVTTCAAYLRENLGALPPHGDLEWLALSEGRLLEFARGEVFYDGVGQLTAWRAYYASYPPQVWKYRLACAWEALGWDVDLVGLCTARGDTLSARHCMANSLYRILRLVFLLNRRYAPGYTKWLHREFAALPHLAVELLPGIEDCYKLADLSVAPYILGDICHWLLDYQETLPELPTVEIQSSPFARGFFEIDCHRIARQIQAACVGELRDQPLYGGVDQWVGHPDLLMDADRLRRLASVYDGGRQDRSTE